MDIIEANLNAQAAQIGGATQAVTLYNDGTTDWTLYSMANRFAVTKVGMSKDTVSEITVPGYIQHITVVKDYGGKNYALLSMGSKGIGVVDLTTPGALTSAAYLRTMTVNYMTPAYTYSDGGGTVFTEPASTTDRTSGAVNDLLVYDDQATPTDASDDQLFIANGSYGIQKTALSNLMGGTDGGALSAFTAQKWTLKYAGENPWGGPVSLKEHGGKLYAALGFLGIGIFDPADLTPAGAYNLYADCTNTAQEDWFGYPKRKISCPDASLTAGVVAGGVDADGMPTHLQAAEELGNKNDRVFYPWAEFDRYGKYYYYARTMELVDLPGSKTMAYVAYSLGGLVAVDVTNATASVKPVYAGYVPAVPAHGPDEPPINVDKKSILSHFGSGMLKEAGVMDVRVVTDPTDPNKYRAYYTDHFAGLVVVSGAEAPATQWKNAGGPFDNNKINGVAEPRVYWPDYEFVKSYDMTPVVVGDESMPAFLVATNGNYPGPAMLATGEINGHGGALFLMPTRNPAAAGQVDAVQSSGAGGVSFVDFVNLTSSNVAVANRFAVPVNLVSTNEVGAKIDGSAGEAIAIGHAEGVTVSGNHLYLADGPHGMSVWRIANGLSPIDDLHLVANTLTDEYPTPGINVAPTPHAFKVGFGSDPTKAYVMSQSLGMRRVDVSAVTGGSAAVGAPALLNAYGNIFEHNTEAGSVGINKVTGQDHAYGVVFSGKYAIVADGDNGVTVYDTTAAAGTDASVVANIGDSLGTSGKPPLGRAATVKLWTNSATGKTYAVVAAGAYGISVVDMTAFLASGNAADLGINKLIKTFEPLKADDDNAFGAADGKSVDVHVVDDIAYFSYDSFGLVAYRMTDLIRPATEERPLKVPTGQAADVCATITDVTKLSAKQGGVGECRPTAVGYLKLQKLTGYEAEEGGALYMTPQYFPANVPIRNEAGQVYVLDKPRLLFYVAYGESGVVKLDWSNVAAPTMMAIKGVVGGASATAINNGRVYVAAGAGGLVVFK
ncbi:MAG: hypothetical protein Q7T10_11075 [Rhodoferax sp.]|uniref:hypothetical protein n=1 Tax=Rhodoferax sp. TaxID=50421 RepID=UPI00272548F4|nr:hypothetical protein [Rhodoferax sp.]MDO8449333.1 hypothetical protein [Rhodoferax sp.]